MPAASTGNSAWQDFSSFGYIIAKPMDIFKINLLNFINTELAYLFANRLALVALALTVHTICRRSTNQFFNPPR